MSNPNPFVPKGSLLDNQSQRRSRLKLAVFCVLAVSVTGLVAMLIQGCKRTPDVNADTTTSASTPADTNAPGMSDITNTPATDTNITAYAPPGTNAAPLPYTPPVAPVTPQVDIAPVAGAEYVVVSGDTLGKIAKRNGVSLKALMTANPGVDSKHLKVKQKLVIPGSTKTADATSGASASANASTSGASDSETTLYTVKTGDTLTKIAKAHGTTSKAIEAANNMTTTRINVGKKLKIPKKAEAAPVATAPVESAPVAPMTAPASTPMTAPVTAPTTR